MDENTKENPPEHSPAKGTAERATEHDGSETVAVTDNTPQDGADVLTTAGIQQHAGHNTKQGRQLPEIPVQPVQPTGSRQTPAIKPPMFPQVQSLKKVHLTSMTENLGSSDTDKTPYRIPSDKGNSTTSTTDIVGQTATNKGTRTRDDKTANISMSGQGSEARQNTYKSNLASKTFVSERKNVFTDQSADHQKQDKPHDKVEHQGDRGEHPKSEDKDRQSSVLTAGDQVRTPKQDKPEGTGSHRDDMNERPDTEDPETQLSGHTSTREATAPKQGLPKPTPSTGEPTLSQQTQRSLKKSGNSPLSFAGKNKPEGISAHTDDTNKHTDAHNKETKPSVHISTSEDEVRNPKPGLSGEAGVLQKTADETEPDNGKSCRNDKGGENGNGDKKTEDSIPTITGPVKESIEFKLADAANDDTKTKKDSVIVKTGPMEGDYRQQKNDGNLKVCKDETVEPNQTQSSKDDWDLLPELGNRTLEQNAKEEDRSQGMEDLSDKSYEQISEDEEKDSQSSGAVSFELHVSSIEPTNIQKGGNPLEEKPNIIIDQAKLKQIGNLWMLTVGSKSIQLPKDIKDARVEGKFLVADDNVIYEIHKNQGAIVLKPIDKAKIQTSQETNTADEQQTKGSKEQSRVYDPPKEKHIASNAPDRGSIENNPVKPKTRALTPSLNETLLPNVEMKDENEDTDDRDVSTIALDDLTNRMTNVSLQEKNDDVECSNNELSMSQTATKSIIEKQTVKASGMSHKARNKSQSFYETAEVGENDMKQFEKSRSGEQSVKKPSLQPEFNDSQKEKDTDQATSAAPTVPPRSKHGKPITSGHNQMTPSNEQTVKYKGASNGSNRETSGPASTGEVIKKKLKCQISYSENKEDASFEIDLEAYMKLKYNLNNYHWLCQKHKNLNEQYPGMGIEYERDTDVMIINLDVNKPPGHQPSIVDNAVQTLLQSSDHLFVNSVPIGGIDKIQVVEMINKHTLVRDKDLYVEYAEDLDYLHYVCPHNVRTLVNVLVQITVKQLSGPKKYIKFDMVFKEIFNKKSMLEKINSENRPMQVSLRDQNNDEFVCMLQGCNEDVTWAENLINTEIIQGHGFANFAIKEIKHCDEFESLELSDLVEETLQHKSDSEIGYHFNKNGTLSICGPIQGDVDTYVANVKKMLKCKTIPIENKDMALSQLEKCKTELQCKIDKHIIITILEGDPYQVNFIGLKDTIKMAENMLLEKINPKKDKATKFKVTECENKKPFKDNNGSGLTCEKKTIWIKDHDVFAHICKKEDLSQLAKMHQIQPDKLEVKEEKTLKGFCVTGGTQRHEALQKYFTQYTCEDLVLTFNDSENMPEVLHEVKRKHNVTLNVEDTPEPSAIEGATGGSSEVIPVAEAAAEKEVDNTKWEFPCGHCLVVVNDNATNRWNDMLVDINIIETGKASDLQVHAASQNRRRTSIYVNRWKDSQNKEKESFQKEMERMLNLAQAYDCKDICIPIATVGNWPPKKYITQILYTVNEHLQKTGMIPVNVQLCTADKTAYRECCDAARIAIPSGSLEEMSRQTKTSGTSSEFNIAKQSIKVNVVKGKLDTIKADIIVNTTNQSLQLHNGAVSYSLLKKAGNKLQEECNKKLKNHHGNISYGDIVMTKGYGLDCDYVFHSALDIYKRSTVSVENLVVDCLKKAADKKYETIAFPAIGTGNLSYPKHEVAAAMFDGVKRFEQECSGSSVKEIYFVVYSADNEAVREFEKYHRQYKSNEKKAGLSSTTHNPNVSETMRLGRINVKARLGTLSNCKTHAIVYLWEKSEFQGAKYDQHCLLKATGKGVQKKFDDQRKLTGDDKYKVFSTPGGNIKFSVIVHAPCIDDYDSIRAALWDSVLLLEKEKMKTASIWFPAQHPLLRHGDKLVEMIVDTVKEVQQSVVCLSEICIVVEGKQNLRKIFQCFRRKCDGKTVMIKIIGKQNDIKYAKDELQPYTATGNLETMPKDDTPHSPTSIPSAPMEQTMQRGQEDVSASGSSPGTENEILDTYVAIENIPKDYNSETLSSALFAALFAASIHIAPPVLVYINGSPNAIAICKSKQEANQLDGFNGLPGIRFKPQSKIYIKSTCTITCDKNKQKFILDQLKNSHVTVQQIGDNQLLIVAPTTYQMQFAKTVCPESTSHKRHQSEFEHVETIKVIPEVWEIVKNVKNENYQVLEDNDTVKVGLKDNIVTIEWSGTVSDDDDIKNSVDVLHSCCRSLHGKDIEEIQLDRYDEEKTQKWCTEVQETLDMKCCLHIPKQKKVFAYCDTYDDLQKVKHQFRIKEGKVKPTGRNRRNMEVEKPPIASGHTAYRRAQSEDMSDFDKEKHNKGHKSDNRFNWNSDAKNVNTYETKEGIIVNVYEASIVNLPVDCIVNAANDNLQHGGGIARVIEKAAGYELTREGDIYLRKNGRIPVGLACTTTAGRLPYDCVIHAVGPRWSDYWPHDFEKVKEVEDTLYSAVMCSFIEAEKRKLNSIAVPAISAAIFAVPEEMCVYQYARAIVDYSRKSGTDGSRLTEIHFIDINPNIIRKIQNMFKVMIEDGMQSNYDIYKFVKSYPSASRSKWYDNEQTNKNYGNGRAAKNHRASAELENPTNTKQTIENVPLISVTEENDVSVVKYGMTTILHLHEKGMFKINAKAIVIVADKYGNGGKLAHEIHSKINVGALQKKYEEEKRTLFQGTLSLGDTPVSNGWGSGYGRIVHAVFPSTAVISQPAYERKQLIMKTYDNILAAAGNNREISSIIMPLIGTTSGLEDIKCAAGAFVDSFTVFCNNRSKHTYKHLDVHLVLRTTDARNIVHTLFKNYATASGKKDKHTPPERPPPPNIDRKTSTTEKPLSTEVTDPQEKESCVICMDDVSDPVTLKCGHMFCKECIEQQFQHKQACPTCGAVCGTITGDQPNGTIDVTTNHNLHLAGYRACGSIVIQYDFPPGRQQSNHPSPGKYYKGIQRTAYLPDNHEGRQICEMLEVAFDRKLVFTIGNSRTTGQEGVITWNDIHHKTDNRANTQFGYPDPTYLVRVKDELAAKGVTEKDIQKQEKKAE